MKHLCAALAVSLLSFSSIVKAQSNYFLNGNAQAIGGDCYQLTSAFPTQNGTVWYADQLDLNDPFSLQFTMNFGNLDVNGADGICFVLQTVGTAAIGTSGGGMGYQNFGTSLGIEFDTWQNGDFGDPFEDHVAIETNGDINHNSFGNVAGPVQIDPFDANVEDGEDHIVQITWDPTTQLIQVYFDCVFRLQGNIDIINSIFNGNSLVYWGFTAATGGSVNNQTVCLEENILNIGNEVQICTGGSIELSVGNSLDGSYSWSPVDYLNDPTSATPIANPPSDITYTVTYTDLCGVDQTTEIQVLVEDLNLSISTPDQLTCDNEEETVLGSINFDLDVNYTWTFNNTSSGGLNVSNFNITSPGVYTVEVNYQNQCFDEIEFEVFGDFTTYPANAGSNQNITCTEEEIILSAAQVNANALYGWAVGANLVSNSSTYTATNPGTYTLAVLNPANGCVTTDQVVIGLDITPPSIFIPEQDTLNCQLRSFPIADVQISDADNYSIDWDNFTGYPMTDTTLIYPIISGPGYYEITVTSDDNGCESTAGINIIADEYFFINLEFMRFPNIVTANGDGLNKDWKPFLSYNTNLNILDLFSTYEMTVFNRWGQELYTTSKPTAYRPSEEVPGVYYYIFNYDITCGIRKSGTIEGTIQIVE
jgi:hypothetical protein